MKCVIVASALALLAGTIIADRDTEPRWLIGYTELRTNLPGGRAANIFTARAFVVNADGTGRREVAPQLVTKPNSWTQFAGWSPNGKYAIVLCGWESSDNAAWEEEHKQFRYDAKGWLMDTWIVDIETGKATNVTGVDRVSFYNTGVFFWPKQPGRLGFQAMIDGESKPFSMNLDGTGKKNLSQQAGYTYGFSAAPDGKRVSYHQDYQAYLADADGKNPEKVETGHPFNFGPAWSPDGQWVEFLSGERTNCHPYLVKRDGTGLRKLADRGGYEGAILVLDVPDFHDGSSDVPVWSRDSKWIFYTAKVGEAVELMRVSLEGKAEQLTKSAPGVLHYHPAFSRDGKWLSYGSTQDGVRQLYVARADGANPRRITSLKKGHAAMWAQWRPAAE
jgi:TolB protein